MFPQMQLATKLMISGCFWTFLDMFSTDTLMNERMRRGERRKLSALGSQLAPVHIYIILKAFCWSSIEMKNNTTLSSDLREEGRRWKMKSRKKSKYS